MKTRAFFLSSVLLGLIALLVHSVASDQIMQSVHRRAQNIAAAVEQHIPIAPDPEATRLRDSGYRLNTVGLAFTLSCVVCGVVAFVRRESGWYSIPIMLLFFDVTVMMLL
jgi:hypothetical protein